MKTSQHRGTEVRRKAGVFCRFIDTRLLESDERKKYLLQDEFLLPFLLNS